MREPLEIQHRKVGNTTLGLRESVLDKFWIMLKTYFENGKGNSFRTAYLKEINK